MTGLNVLIGSPESALLRVACAQMARFCRLPAFTTAPDTDAHGLDERNAWERALTCFAAFAAGTHLICNAGMFSTATCACAEQMLIDAELHGICARMLGGIAVDPDALAVPSILDLPPDGDFLTDDLTLRHLRDGEHRRPIFPYRLAHPRWQAAGGKPIEQAAREAVEAILAARPPRPIPEARLRDLEAIVRR
jgi:trimethylamine--corrinoid protein Co-methyltransferase